MAKKMKWTWGAVGAALLALLSFFGGDFVWEAGKLYLKERNESAYEMQIKDFDKLSLITTAELSDKGVRFTYYTCHQPELHYTVHYIVNGRLMKTEGPFDPKDYNITNRCFTWTGDWHDDLDVSHKDDVVIRWHFGDYGIADLEIIVK